jgi:gliding motility-associated-like protein
MNLTKQTNGRHAPFFLRASKSGLDLVGILSTVANQISSALNRPWMYGWGLPLLVVLTLLTIADDLKAQTTETFASSPTLISHPSVPSWKTSAEVTIGGVVYEIQNGGNGGWAFSGSGGVSNSSSLFYSTAATSSITIKRKDGARFQFYGVWLKYKNFTSGYTAPWLTANYNGSGASSDTYGSNTTVTISKNLNVTTVTLMFSGLWELNFDNLIVGPAIASLPTVTTTAADLIGGTYASLGGNVTSDGGGTITDRGIVYSTSPSPAIGDGRGEQVAIGTGSGVFSQTVSGFSLSTTYYVRAYAINSAGTSYGSQITFTTTDGTGPITLLPSMDTYIEDGSGYSTSQTNYVGDWWGWYSDAAIKFNLAAVTGTVSDAKLRLYVSEVGAGTVFAKIWGSNDDAWLATTNAVPSKNTSLSDNVSITATGWKEFDVTAFIKQQAEGDGTASMVIAGNTAEGDNWFGFKSDNSATNKPQLVVTVAAGNTAPTASLVAISGAAEVGGTLTGTYNYTDTNSDAESGSTYKWYRGVADVCVAPDAIAGATQTTYILQPEDEGKYITFEVTPSDGTDAGSAMVSERLGPVVQTVLLASSPTISFSNEVGFEDNIAQDGDGGSAVISDLNLQVMPVNSSGVKLEAQPIQYHDNTQSGWSGYPAIITYGDTDAHFGWSIRSDNGAAFSLVSVDFHDWGGYEGDTFVAEAFLDASSKGTITFTGNLDGNYIALTNSGILPSVFANVDEVRIYKQGGANSWISLNNIQVSSAVLTGPPTVSSTTQTNLASTSVTLGGNVTSNGGLDVTERGVVYATTAGPTMANTKVQIGSGTGTFSHSVTGLEVNTTYYFRAYAINSLGTSYGNELSFSTPKIAQTISFDPISEKTWGDEPFTVGIERTDQNQVVTYVATDPSIVTIVGNQATIKKAGSTTITASQAGDDTYAVAVAVEQTLTVNKKALTVTAEDKTKEYGATDPANTVTYAGFISGEDATDLGGTLSFSRTAGENVATYAITPSGLTSGNYAISFAAGELEITKKALIITAEDKTKQYGEADPTATVVYHGLVEGDNATDFSGVLAFTRTIGENPGVYTISPSGLTSGNYTVSFADGELQITPRQLTVQDPVLTKAKLHDGLTTAEVLAGALVGVVDGDVVELTAAAAYDNPNSGVDKTITVTYTIAGADAFKYVAPTSLVVADGEIIEDVAPVFTSVGSPSVKENETNVLVVTATDGNEGATITYSLSGGWDMALFTIDAITGELTFKSAPDFEQPTDANGDNVYVVQVTATDGVNVINQIIEVFVTNENDSVPVVLAAQSFQVAETVASGTLVGKVMGHDSDEGTELEGWAIVSGNDDGIFGLSAASGDLVVANSATLAMQTATSYTLTLTVSDGIHISIETEINVLVIRGQQASLVAAADSYEVNEDEVLAVDAPGVLVNDGNVVTAGLQAVLVENASHGSLVLNANGSFVYTPDANFNGTEVFSYKVVEGEIASETVSVTVEVLPVNDAPHAIIFNNVNVAEDAAPGFKAAEFNTEDIDSDSHTYELVDGEGAIDNESFIIEGNKLLTNVRFDIDEITLLSVRVRTTDPAGAYLERVFGVQVVPGFHPDLVIPSAFTPNNDNVNDSWEFENAHFYRNMSVNIYNRQGRLVFSSVGYRQPWTGQRNGVSLPLDMYYYVIELNDGSGRGYKSYVMILQ